MGVISFAGGAVVLGAVGDGWMLEAEPVVVLAQDDWVERQWTVWTVMRTAVCDCIDDREGASA